MAFNRRGFLKFVAGGAVGTALTPLPWKLIDDVSIWTQNWPWIPRIPDGNVESKPSLVKLGATEYGILITTVDGQPITAAGNPNHPLSLGGIDPLTAASVQLLHSPARVSRPLHKEAGGGFRPLSWSKATDILVDKLAPLQGRQGSVACINGDETSSAHEIISALLGEMHSASAQYFMPSEAGTQQAVWQNLLGGQGSLGYDLEGADLILCINADIFGSWGTAIRNQKVISQGQAACLYAGPARNSTAAIADEWVPVLPEKGAHLALSLASLLLQSGWRPKEPVQGLAELSDFLQREYSSKAIPKKTGLSLATVKSLAERLTRAERPLVMAGSLSGLGGDPIILFAGLVLNALLGRVNANGGLRCIPTPPKVLGRAGSVLDTAKNDLCSFVSDLARGKAHKPDLLLVYEANPMYALPNSETTGAALASIPFKISFSQFMDETAAECDLILPAPYFLERLDDSFTPFGSGSANYSMAEPVARPNADVRPTPDFLLDIMGRLGLQTEVGSYEELLTAKANLLGANTRQLLQGSAWQDGTTARQPPLRLWNASIEECLNRLASGATHQMPLSLAVESELKTGTARTAIPPFGLSTLREEELDHNGFAVRLNSQTASELGLQAEDMVELISSTGKCSARLLLDESVIPGTVVVPSGFGHTHWDEYSRGKGDSVFKILDPRFEPGCGRTMWSDTRVKIAKI